MVNKRKAKKYCKDDISKIENYDKAIADTTQTWICHHRLALTLDGEFAHSHDDLKRPGMYYYRPYFELIFMTKSEHDSLHNTGKTLSDETKKKLSDARKGKAGPNKGRTFSEESRKKMSEAAKGRTSPNKGKTRSEETRKKISEAGKAAWAKRKEGGK